MSKSINPKQILKNPLLFIAFGFGSGFAPLAPGTFGTLVAIPIYLLFTLYMSWPVYIIVVFMLTGLSMWLCQWASKLIEVHDAPGMNVDEIVGFLIAMLGINPGFKSILLGFVLFRFFDIYKPWPISWIDKNIRNGVGMVLDDIAAGVATCVILHGLGVLSIR